MERDPNVARMLDSMRRLAKQIDDSEVQIIEGISEGSTMEQTIARMIDMYPRVWGKGGSHRRWLEFKAAEYGIDGDFGLQSEQGPFNQPNE